MIPNHAMAFYCLAKACLKKGLKEAAEDASRSASEIVKEDAEWQGYFNHFGIGVKHAF